MIQIALKWLFFLEKSQKLQSKWERSYSIPRLRAKPHTTVSEMLEFHHFA